MVFVGEGGAGRLEDGLIGLLAVAGLVWACGNYVVASPTDFEKWGKVDTIIFRARNCHSAGLMRPFWDPDDFCSLGGTLGS